MSDNLEVTPVHSRSERRAFLKLPWSIYRDDPCWVPPLRMTQKAMAGYSKHPFYAVATAQTFLARRGRQVCGRISAIKNPAHNRRHEDELGFFGFFECTDDQEAASALLAAAADWLRQQDLKAMRGPVNPSMNYECGLLVDGFDTPPTFMITYNPQYYEQLLLGYGLEKSQDMYSYMGDVEFLENLDPKLYRIMYAAQEKFNVQTRKINTSNYKQDVGLILDLYNRATVGGWGFVPLSEAEAEHLGKELRIMLEPDLVRIAEIEDQPVGVLMALLDYNPLIKKINGRLFPFGWFQLLFRRKTLKHCRFLSANVVPEYQRWGLGLILLGANKQDGLALGLETAEFSWVLESNDLSRMTLEKSGMQPHKTHRLFDIGL